MFSIIRAIVLLSVMSVTLIAAPVKNGECGGPGSGGGGIGIGGGGGVGIGGTLPLPPLLGGGPGSKPGPPAPAPSSYPPSAPAPAPSSSAPAPAPSAPAPNPSDGAPPAPAPSQGSGSGSSGSSGGGQCNTGAVQCCNSVQAAGSPEASSLLTFLQIVVSGVDVPIGLTCSPINVLGNGGGCTSQPLCCENNSYNGLVAIGCTPINLNL